MLQTSVIPFLIFKMHKKGYVNTTEQIQLLKDRTNILHFIWQERPFTPLPCYRIVFKLLLNKSHTQRGQPNSCFVRERRAFCFIFKSVYDFKFNTLAPSQEIPKWLYVFSGHCNYHSNLHSLLLNDRKMMHNPSSE